MLVLALALVLVLVLAGALRGQPRERKHIHGMF